MIIKGFIMYDCIEGLPEKDVSIDTSKRIAACDRDVCDDVSFAMFGKTVFNDLLRKEKGVPEISLTIECKGNTVHIFRKPQYLRVTYFGTEYLTDVYYISVPICCKYATFTLFCQYLARIRSTSLKTTFYNRFVEHKTQVPY